MVEVFIVIFTDAQERKWLHLDEDGLPYAPTVKSSAVEQAKNLKQQFPEYKLEIMTLNHPTMGYEETRQYLLDSWNKISQPDPTAN